MLKIIFRMCQHRAGGKMELQALKFYLMSKYGTERIDALFWEMQMIMLRALLAVQPSMIHDKHCFELYGKGILPKLLLLQLIYISKTIIR